MLNPDWLQVYHEYNKDLSKLQLIMVGEKNGEVFKSHIFFSDNETDGSSFPNYVELLEWINSSLNEYFPNKPLTPEEKEELDRDLALLS